MVTSAAAKPADELMILSLYQRLYDTFREAVAQAQVESWDEVAKNGSRSEALTLELAELERDCVLSASAQEQKSRLVREALALANDLRALAEPARAALAAQLGDNVRHHKVVKAYGR